MSDVVNEDGLMEENEDPRGTMKPRRISAAVLVELSDSEFVETLLDGLEHRSWTGGQLIALERRGFHILEEYPPLAEAINEVKQSFNVKMQAVRAEHAQMVGDIVSQTLAPFRERIAFAAENVLAPIRDSVRRLQDSFSTLPDLRRVWLSFLEAVEHITLQEGIPIIGVLPPGVEGALLYETSDAQERSRVLANAKDEILDHCLHELSHIDGEFAQECRNAVRALREGHSSPAQSHAANIAEGILNRLFRDGGSQVAKEEAELDVRALASDRVWENLALKPVNRAFTRWYAHQGLPMPKSFSRHATAHAVGQPGLFSEEKALIAVMLAVSLTIQFRGRLPDQLIETAQ